MRFRGPKAHQDRHAGGGFRQNVRHRRQRADSSVPLVKILNGIRGSCEVNLGQAKAFHAKAPSRKVRKENKVVVLCYSLRLGVLA